MRIAFALMLWSALTVSPIKSRRRTDIVTIIGPGLPNPVVGIKATLQPVILKAFDPIHYVQALRIFGLQAFGSPGCQREQYIDHCAPPFFGLCSIVTVVVGRVGCKSLPGRLIHSDGPGRRARRWRQRDQSNHHVRVAHAPLERLHTSHRSTGNGE